MGGVVGVDGYGYWCWDELLLVSDCKVLVVCELMVNNLLVDLVVVSGIGFVVVVLFLLLFSGWVVVG